MRTRLRWLSRGRGACALLYFATAVIAPMGATTYQAGSWPLEVTLVPDKHAILLGEPTSVSFIVKNLSREDLQILVGGDYQNELGRPSSFQVRVRRSDGRWVDQPKVGFSTGGLIGPKPLPGGGSYVFRLFLPHWATFEIPGTYTVSCKRILQVLRADVGREFARHPTTDVLTEAQVTLEVEPRDPAALGLLIEEYGETMLRAKGEKEGDAAVLALAWIDDPRVVPYFSRALATRSYTIKFIALHVLGKFGTDEAFAALQAGMKTSAADFDTGSAGQAVRNAANIRTAAAGALRRCTHPKAREYLLAQRHDDAEGVRVTVLHVLGAMPAAEATPLIREMAEDQSQRIRDEAQRYLARSQAPDRESELVELQDVSDAGGAEKKASSPRPAATPR